MCRPIRNDSAARVLALAMLASASACGPEAVGKSAPAVTIASTPQRGSASSDTARRHTLSDSSARDSAVAKVPSSPAEPATHVVVAPSASERRTSHDSISYTVAIRAGLKRTQRGEWPVSGPMPLSGSVFPEHRIVAFYGNPLSKHMGVLGEYPAAEMLARLDQEVKRWQDADPSTPTIPALHLIAVVAQGSPGKDGTYRLRMPDTLIERVYQWAQTKHALLFLDIQVGHSTVRAELPRLLHFLERPDVHLGLDPEFSMHYDKEGSKPGTKIGTLMADDINYAAQTLAELVTEKHLTPKVLVVHRFTKRMLPNPRHIHLDPRVQIVMDMDGWGPPWLKFDSYRDYEVADPVQFTGFKLSSITTRSRASH